MSNEMDGAPAQTPTMGRGVRYDVVVVGGGAAGLSGALALVRARRSVLVVDGGQPRNAPAAHMHNYLSRDGTPPSELLAHGRAEVAGYGGQIITGRVTAVERVDGQDDPGGFQVALADGTSVYARRLLVATGLIDELPDVPGVRERWGRDVLHCPYCHGWEVRDQAIGILCTGPMATHMALMFRQLSADVVLFQHTGPALSEEQAEQLAARGITIIEGEVSALEVHDDRLTGVRLRSGEFIPRQAVVVSPRLATRAELLRSLGLETTDQEVNGHIVSSYVAADAIGATSVPGVWVAGNVTVPFAQVIAAAAAGLMAGAAINADLITEETARAVAAFRARRSATPEPSSATRSRAGTRNSKFIKAPPEALYRVLTDPAALAVWRVPGDMTGEVHHFDYRVGGGYQMSLYYPSSEQTLRGKTSGREDRYTARFVELTPPRRIVEAIMFDSPDPAFQGEMIMEVTLEAEAGGTTVSIEFKNLPSGIQPEDNEAGTRSALEKLARYAE
jgi:thioredoxin reductase/uncharacterized protein YndB with AHSA1/START domain